MCALLDNQTVKCWGNNSLGRLGIGDTEPRGDDPNEMGDMLPTVQLGTGRTAVAIAAGGFHTCAILDDATVKCWGSNLDAELGIGSTATSRGAAAGTMGDALPAVALGTGRTAKSIVAGERHTCALLDNDTVKCWGLGTLGRLGYGDATSRGSQASQMGDGLPVVAVNELSLADKIRAGGTHTCVLSVGVMTCWGDNFRGQLGLGDTNARGDQAGEMGAALPALDFGPINDPPGSGHVVVDMFVAEERTCVILDDRNVKCWAANDLGQSGLGDVLQRGDQSGEMGLALPVVAL
jgi:alpha-tubulin suppressor-like RCC1 family protein